MSKNASIDDVERIVGKAVDDLSGVITAFANNVDERFEQVDKRLGGVENRLGGVEKGLIGVKTRLDHLETSMTKMQKDMRFVMNQLDSLAKDISINEDERLVIGMQLTRMHEWIEKAADKIGIEFAH